MNCPLIPDPSVYPCLLSSCDFIEKLIDGDESVPFSPKTILKAACIGDQKKTDLTLRTTFNDDCAHILVRTLLRIDESGPKGGMINRCCKLRRKKIKMDVFETVKYYHWPDGRRKMQERSVLNVVDNAIFVNELKDLIKATIAAVGSRDRPRKGKSKMAFGVVVDDILEEEVRKWFSEKAPVKLVRPREISIDMSKVEQANDNLEHVTKLMAVDEPESPVIESVASAPTRSAQTSADPWQSFAEALNKGQREYLRKALAGTLRAPKSMTDDAINAIALDTVKDTVIENGAVFEDYIEDIRLSLGL